MNNIKWDENMIDDNQINCSRPQDYFYDGCESSRIIHIWEDQTHKASVHWLIVFDDGDVAWVNKDLIKKKPQFKPEWGKIYWCNVNNKVITNDCPEPYFDSSLVPIPQSIKEQMVFEGE